MKHVHPLIVSGIIILWTATSAAWLSSMSQRNQARAQIKELQAVASERDQAREELKALQLKNVELAAWEQQARVYLWSAAGLLEECSRRLPPDKPQVQPRVFRIEPSTGNPQ